MVTLDRRLIKNFDFVLLLLLLVICAVSTLMLFSATRFMEDLPSPLHFVQRQLFFLSAGLVIMFLVCFIDYINFNTWARYIYAGNVFLLVLVPLIGTETRGAMRWISIGYFELQPSEISKIALVIILAKILADKEGIFTGFQDLLPAFAATAIPAGLIFLQPDLDTALIFIAVLMGMFYSAGVSGRHLAAIIGSGLAAAPVIWFFLLEEYQKMRLMVFVNPGMDPLQSGYQLLQSLIGIGSGGLLGKGIFQGTQARLEFLPDHYTDFIFAVLAEELGFVGAAGLMVLYILIIYRILVIGTHSKDQFGALICFGVAILFTVQILINVGMTIGIMPVTGLPLPFLSYGNNALLINLFSVGLVLNVGMRRHKIQF